MQSREEKYSLMQPAYVMSFTPAKISFSENQSLRDDILEQNVLYLCGDLNRPFVRMKDRHCWNWFPKEFMNHIEVGEDQFYTICRR